jgi:hypothetical protein
MQTPNEASLHEKLFVHTSSHHMTGVLELVERRVDGGREEKDVRIKVCNTLLPFFGEERKDGTGWFREMGVQHEVVASWVDAAQKLSPENREVQV